MTEQTQESADQGTQDTSENELRAEIEKLKAKNRELLTEKQKAKLAEQTARDEADDAATQAAMKSGDIEALKASHARELKKAQDAAAKFSEELRVVRVDNAIAAGIQAGNVKPEYAKAVTAMLKSEVQYQDGIATIEGQPIDQYVGSYLSSKDGNHFVRAADNGGAGATGSDHRQTAQQFSETAYAEMLKVDRAGAHAWAKSTNNDWIIN